MTVASWLWMLAREPGTRARGDGVVVVGIVELAVDSASEALVSAQAIVAHRHSPISVVAPRMVEGVKARSRVARD